MEQPFEEFATLAGKVVAKRWLARNAARRKRSAVSSNEPDDERHTVEVATTSQTGKSPNQ